MSNDVKALIAELRGDNPRAGILARAADALEAATATPAVDREALARFFDPWAWDCGDPSRGAVQVSRAESLSKADAAIASGVLRDVRDVQAEALEEAARHIHPTNRESDWTDYAKGLGRGADLLEFRAQAIREARND